LESHFHDFDKIVVFIAGNVTYLVEGRTYKLKPWDILLIGRNEIHKPVIDFSQIYERIVIWVNPGYLQKHSSEDSDMELCFKLAAENGHNLLRPDPDVTRSFKHMLRELKDACENQGFGSRILENSILMQFLVHLNRAFLGTCGFGPKPEENEFNENIGSIIKYINEHLSEDLSIDSIAEKFFISRYYLMHRFKKSTGYSIHNYIMQKRLILAGTLLKKGMPATEASVKSGFGDYSNFMRAFKRMYGISPREYYKRMAKLEELFEVGKHFRQ